MKAAPVSPLSAAELIDAVLLFPDGVGPKHRLWVCYPNELYRMSMVAVIARLVSV